jgi:hypothetical protein
MGVIGLYGIFGVIRVTLSYRGKKNLKIIAAPLDEDLLLVSRYCV